MFALSSRGPRAALLRSREVARVSVEVVCVSS
jgi:hypothetical protein